MLPESLLSALAEAVFGYLLQEADLADRVRAVLGVDPERRAFQSAEMALNCRSNGEAQAAGVTVTASGSRSVAIGGNVTGSVIVTGDKNQVER